MVHISPVDVPGRALVSMQGPTVVPLANHFRSVRAASDALCGPLTPEDGCIQTMPDVSPAKWHLAHTTWFFETFVLERFAADFRPRHPEYRVLFNSYYNGIGEQFPRGRRGILSRPSFAEVQHYRREIDDRVAELLVRDLLVRSDRLQPVNEPAEAGHYEPARIVEIGLHHEQQHQELMLTDIKHVFWSNPLRPAYLESRESRVESPEPEKGESRSRLSTLDSRLSADWIEFDGGLTTVGHHAAGFAFDNEGPAHDVYLQPFQLASRPVTNRELLDFIDDGGYRQPELWLSDGWDAVQREGWKAPLYWEQREGEWRQFTLSGMRPLEPDEPVCHVSYFEADAFARWSHARLPTEAEWETAARTVEACGHFADSGWFHPHSGWPGRWSSRFSVSSRAHSTSRAHAEAWTPTAPLASPAGVSPGSNRGHPGTTRTATLHQMFGDVWEWTASPYVAYPGYQAAAGALGEYNGKFMCNQFVLRGGSCVTPADHIRSTYRNFFQPEKRWQFSGIRLARDA